MPEGDTIFRTARTLERVIGGRALVAVETSVPKVRALGVQRLVGQTVRAVESRGKHLLVWFAPSDLALHTHLMMAGSWHTYAAGERWRKPAHRAKAVLRTADAVAVCFSAPVVELLSRAQVERHRALVALGPDALDPRADLAEARRRLDADPDRPIGVALLDQRVLAGIGNVFRCEVLFIHAVDPWAPVGDVPPETRDALLATAERLLKANAGRDVVRRVTTAGGAPHHVYGRARRPCARCRTPIRVARLGEPARLVYWCARCQRRDR
jgi:endonuclease VIII